VVKRDRMTGADREEQTAMEMTAAVMRVQGEPSPYADSQPTMIKRLADGELPRQVPRSYA
jgi:hypothetical protein